jgi:hypothetical protein
MFGSSFDAIDAVRNTARLLDQKFDVQPELATSPYSQMSDKVFASELHTDTHRVQIQIVSRRRRAIGDGKSIGGRYTIFIQRQNSSN